MTESKEKKPIKRRRNRVQTELKLLYALETHLTEKGFDSLGVNAIAKTAGVSKGLIYRYFGGLEGLILVWMEERDFWSAKRIDAARNDRAGRSKDPAEIIQESLSAFLADLRQRPQIQQIRRWEIASRSSITERIARRREEAGVDFISRIPNESGEDIAALYAVLQAGLCYLVLRSSVLENYSGVPLRSDKGWERIEKMVGRIVSAIIDEPAKISPSRRSKKQREYGPS